MWDTWVVLASAMSPYVQAHARPGPSVYLLEALVVSVAGAVLLLIEPLPNTRLLQLLWAFIGAIAGLSILGAMSIGLTVAYSAIPLLAAVMLRTVRTQTPLERLIFWMAGGFVLQIVVMVLFAVLTISQVQRGMHVR